MLHPQKARVAAKAVPARVARETIRALAQMARPADGFDPAALIGPLICSTRSLARLRVWARDRNMWVRRASIVGLVPRARRGESLDLVYEIARRLHGDEEDLIQKAVGWALREAGKTDMPRLERYLRANGAGIPRTTLRYATERFPAARRQRILVKTR